MKSSLTPLRGMKDICFDEYEIFKFVEDTAFTLSKTYGFQGIQTPILESINVFDRTLGKSSDVISKEIYSFQDKKGRTIALRPEFTASVMRAVLSNNLQQKLPLKLFSTGPLFRYDRPQEGRQRQFYQLNFEHIGKKGPSVDAEMISCSFHLLQKLGIANDLSLELNSLGCSESREKYQSALVEYFKKYLNDLSEDSQKRLEKNPLRILDSKDKSDIEIARDAPELDKFYTKESAQYFEKVKDILTALNITYTENTKLVRGLDYYLGTVFEYTTTKLGAQSTVLAGGRYDLLAQMMGARSEIPAIGFAAGYERIMLMREFQIQKMRNVYILTTEETAILPAIKLADYLRKNNIATCLEFEGKLAKRMQNAISNNAQYIIFLGESEISAKYYTLRNLDSKEEKRIQFNQLKEALTPTSNLHDLSITANKK
ncbi:MAG TPA: histidine--tRNA ligase [Candidatus Megaira endosymbiont of Nemacystus decipiens]|nr:histidine--tRNA ligase [Candidatus Megaera endosymbiont of Nemacystus decipiens]